MSGSRVWELEFLELEHVFLVFIVQLQIDGCASFASSCVHCELVSILTALQYAVSRTATCLSRDMT
jgi:hypothetical protein